MEIKTYTNFENTGTLVTMDVDIREYGLPSIDIVGIGGEQADLSRHILREATARSSLQIPPKRILIAFHPCDLLKVDVGQDLAVSLAVQGACNPDQFPDQKVFVMGQLMPDGRVVQRKAMEEGVRSAIEDGITNFIVPEGFQFNFPSECNVNHVSSLSAAVEVCKDINNYTHGRKKEDEIIERIGIDSVEEVKFQEDNSKDEIIQKFVEQYPDIVKAIEVAVAGKHHLLLTGHPDCCNSTIIETLVPSLTPLLTEGEQHIVKRIEAIVALDPQERTSDRIAPFRHVHPITSLEGMIGGGYECMPGEISLAHNGTLYLADAHDFRTSCLRALNVPLENGNVTLVRGDRQTVYPSSFQLMMTIPPSPDGNYLVEGKSSQNSSQCVCQMWNKISVPLLERIELKQFMDNENSTRYDPKELTLEKMKFRIARAYKIQRQNGVYNSRLDDSKINYCSMDESVLSMLANFKENSMTEREVKNLVKVSLTIANMDGRENIIKQDLAEAMSLTSNPKMRTLLMPVVEPFTHKVENNFYTQLAEHMDFYPKEDIIRSAARILKFFNTDEKDIIRRTLKNRSVQDRDSLERILIKGIEKRRNPPEILKVKNNRGRREM